MSTLSVTTLRGLSTSPTPTKVEVASGHTLHAPGHVIQVVQGELLTQDDISSSTYADVVSQAIIPKLSSSKILIQCTGCGTPQTANALYFKLLRGSTEIGSGTGAGYYNVICALTNPGNGEQFDVKGWAFQFLDSPNTTSSTTYKIQAAAVNGTAKVGGRQDNTDIAVPTRITLMEIAQ